MNVENIVIGTEIYFARFQMRDKMRLLIVYLLFMHVKITIADFFKHSIENFLVFKDSYGSFSMHCRCDIEYRIDIIWQLVLQ